MVRRAGDPRLRQASRRRLPQPWALHPATPTALAALKIQLLKPFSLRGLPYLVVTKTRCWLSRAANEVASAGWMGINSASSVFD
jgi:hypothetical protein